MNTTEVFAFPLAGCKRGFCALPENASCSDDPWSRKDLVNCSWWRRPITQVERSCERHGSYRVWADEACPSCELAKRIEDIEDQIAGMENELGVHGEGDALEALDEVAGRPEALRSLLSLYQKLREVPKIDWLTFVRKHK